jgi:hypothetical protein
MPSTWHDSVTAIFTKNPKLAVELATSLSEAERARITGCTNLRQLKKWVQCAATAEKASDLFA